MSQVDSTVRLRPTTPADLDFVLSAEQHPDNSGFVLPWTRDRHLAVLSDPDIAHWIVEPAGGGKPVGFVMMAGLTNSHASIELKRVIITEKGHGYGRAAVRAIKQRAFTELGAHRLWLDVFVHNTRARPLYESEGFVAEGTLRECLRVGNGFGSLVLMSMLESEYQKTTGATGTAGAAGS